MIESIKIRDFLSHKDTEICLGNSTSVFVGNNGSGKSSVVDAITFALFGKHTRKNNRGLVRRGASSAFVQVIFTVEGTKYMASRKIGAKGEASATLQMHDGVQWQVLITGERRQFGESMTSRVEEILGMDYEKLLIAGIVQQGDLALIIDESPKKFKETLNGIIGIDKLDTADAFIGDAVKKFRTHVREKLGFDDSSIPKIESELTEHGRETLRLEPRVMAHNESMLQTKDEALELKLKLEKGREKLDAAVQLRAHQGELVRYAKDLAEKMRVEVKSDREKIAQCKKYLLIRDSVHSTKSDLERIIQQEIMGRKSVQDQRSSLAGLEEKMNLARSLHLIDGKCPVCDSAVLSLKPIYDEKHLHSAIKEAKSLIIAADESVSKLGFDANHTRDEIEKRHDADIELGKYSIEYAKQVDALQEDTDLCERKADALFEQINSDTILVNLAIDERSSQIYAKIINLRSKVAGFNEDEFQGILRKIEDANQKMLSIQKDFGADSEALKQAKWNAEVKSKLLAELHAVSGFIQELEKIRSIVYGRDGHVATSLRSWALGSISKKTASYLDMFDTKVQRIEMEDKKKDFTIKCYSGTTELDIKSLSGGERVCVALALRLSMAAVFGASRMNFVILDEPTAYLDAEKKSALVNAITQRSESQNNSKIQLVIISHDREIFENTAVENVYSFEPDGSLPDSPTIVKSK